MLSGCRILVVEDEALVSAYIDDLLTDSEAVVVGPVSSVRDARQLLASDTRIDAALLDMNLADGSVTPLLEALTARRVPTLVYSGAELPQDVRRRHPGLVALSKPVQPARLLAELRRVMKTPA